jgi:4'-phosphopantetheinyl transferase
LNAELDLRYLNTMVATTMNRLAAPRASVVHLWPAPLAGTPRVKVACLSHAERDRLALRHGVAARRFAFTHAALRHVAAAYEGCAPKDARLAAAYGEPPCVGAGLWVSLAHCDDLALVAVASSAVGVDVEPVASRPSDADELGDVSDATLTPAELGLLGRTNPRRQPGLWLRLWVRKEAALKARGARLGDIPLFELDASGDRLEELVFVDVTPDPEHVGAIALAAPTALVEWKEVPDVT